MLMKVLLLESCVLILGKVSSQINTIQRHFLGFVCDFIVTYTLFLLFNKESISTEWRIK